MKEPWGPTEEGFIPGKSCISSDLEAENIRVWALKTMNPKYMRLLHREAETIIRPASLRARFTEKEAHAIFEGSMLVEAFYEIADLTGSALAAIRDRSSASLGGRPFEITMTVESIANTGHEAVNASSANLLEIYDQAFSPDPITEHIKSHILADEKFHNDATCNALCLDIHGTYTEDEIASANDGIKRLAGYGYNSRVVQPTLSMALQGAISRFSLTQPFRPSTTRTTAIGPKGTRIIVMAHSPIMPIMLCEEAHFIGEPTGIGLPENLVIAHCLFKPLIAKEDIN